MKNILVLGGTGFVGTRVCEQLLQAGHRVTLPTRRRRNARHLQHLPMLTVQELNVHDEAALAAALQGHDAVVNLVAILHGDGAAFEKAHVTLPQKLARACVAADVRQVVHVSALGVDTSAPEQAPSMYLRSKAMGELALVQASKPVVPAGLELSILRPSVIFGAHDKFLNLFAKLQKVFPLMPLAGAEAKFQPVWVDDVARAVVCCVDLPASVSVTPRVLEVCGPEVFTLKQLVQISAELAGVNGGGGRPVIPLPMWVGKLQALAMELAPGEPLMSRDNLGSMQVPNIATGQLPGLESLGIRPSSLRLIAGGYLAR
jgi:NADH dehydrogenase